MPSSGYLYSAKTKITMVYYKLAALNWKGPERRSGGQKKNRNCVPVRSGSKRTLLPVARIRCNRRHQWLTLWWCPGARALHLRHVDQLTTHDVYARHCSLWERRPAWWHILPQHIICLCDLHLWPIYIKIGSRDQHPIVKLSAYFEVYRPLRFWNIRS